MLFKREMIAISEDNDPALVVAIERKSAGASLQKV